MDDADVAQAIAENIENAALKARLTRITPREGRIQGLHPQGVGPSSRILCEECGNPIPKARLKAVPETKLCVKCQSAYELFMKRSTID